ncbi:hypothetical protein NLG97_g11370 [Lecanicillium saksenae]|uniref:Uncharacterized protein n=1 Tax=Lecanicillium saksenae TaxID=468837 RepID=A0ACC1QCZ6_9HYPO|nr:hypothetical protein NLG97_g11370 [Lecanicillium saksenae]
MHVSDELDASQDANWTGVMTGRSHSRRGQQEGQKGDGGLQGTLQGIVRCALTAAAPPNGHNPPDISHSSTNTIATPALQHHHHPPAVDLARQSFASCLLPVRVCISETSSFLLPGFPSRSHRFAILPSAASSQLNLAKPFLIVAPVILSSLPRAAATCHRYEAVTSLLTRVDSRHPLDPADLSRTPTETRPCSQPARAF